jgi:hypothetical protein
MHDFGVVQPGPPRRSPTASDARSQRSSAPASRRATSSAAATCCAGFAGKARQPSRPNRSRVRSPKTRPHRDGGPRTRRPSRGANRCGGASCRSSSSPTAACGGANMSRSPGSRSIPDRLRIRLDRQGVEASNASFRRCRRADAGGSPCSRHDARRRHARRPGAAPAGRAETGRACILQRGRVDATVQVRAPGLGPRRRGGRLAEGRPELAVDLPQPPARVRHLGATTCSIASSRRPASQCSLHLRS